MMDYRDNVQNCRDYIRALEEEQRKIQVFQRELPLCLQLVTQTIEAYKQQLSGTTTATTGECFNGGEAGKHPKQQESECSEQTTGDGGPIFEEFIPINRASSSAYNEHNDNDVLPSHESKMTKMIRDSGDNIYDNDKSEMKSDWLRSAQLWNQTTSFPPFPSTKEEHHHNLPRKVLVVEVKKNGRGGAFQPFQKDKTNATAADGGGSNSKPASTPAASACSTAEEAPAPGGADNSGSSVGKKDDKDGGQTQRKTRRCWSPELHRRFLSALQQLGGSHVATPKQIRDLMKVDGLTNDEVKSHLQKYRLHTRRPAPATHHNSTNNTQAQQFVIVGGIWVPPPPEYAAATALGATATVSVATAAASNGRIHTPIAIAPQRPVTTESTGAATAPAQFSHSDEGGRSHSDGGRVRSNSPASSSSTHTTTASPAF